MIEKKIVVNFDPIDFGENNEYHYNAQIWSYSHGTWWYAGMGKYFKSIEEVIAYAKEKNLYVEFK